MIAILLCSFTCLGSETGPGLESVTNCKICSIGSNNTNYENLIFDEILFLICLGWDIHPTLSGSFRTPQLILFTLQRVLYPLFMLKFGYQLFITGCYWLFQLVLHPLCWNLATSYFHNWILLVFIFSAGIAPIYAVIWLPVVFNWILLVFSGYCAHLCWNLVI